MMKAMENYITKDGLEKLKKELEYLKNVKTKEIADKIRRAVSFGDLKENAAYHEAKDSQAFNMGRIAELESLIKNAKIIEKEGNEKISLGSTVTIKSEEGEDVFRIVGPEESDPVNHRISHLSPLGKELLGKKEGEEIELNAPSRKIKYKIVSIE